MRGMERRYRRDVREEKRWLGSVEVGSSESMKDIQTFKYLSLTNLKKVALLSLQQDGGRQMKTSDLFKDSSAAASSVAGMYTVLCVTVKHGTDRQTDKRRRDERGKGSEKERRGNVIGGEERRREER